MPAAVLTPRAVSTLSVQPGRRLTLYHDQHADAPRGFALRVGITGRRTYYLLATLRGGRRSWVRVADARSVSLRDARKAARALAGEIAQGRDPVREARAAAEAERLARAARERAAVEWSTADLLEAYIVARRAVLSPRTLKFYDWQARSIRDSRLGRIPARAVVRDDVRAYLRPMAKRAPARAAHELAILRAAWRWAMDEEVRIAGRPEARVERDPTRRVEQDLGLVFSRRRERHLSDAEIPVFWRGLEALAPTWAAFCRLILLCGTRRGETYAARWSNLRLDGDAPLWFIPAADRKGTLTGPMARRALTVPLSPQAVQVLQAIQPVTGRGDLVFRVGWQRAAGRFVQVQDRRTIPITKLGMAVQEVTGIPDITIHDLRRSCASGLQRLGAPPHVISAVLGHTREAGSLQADAHYAHGGRLAEHRVWLERWASHVERLVRQGASAPADIVPFLR
jgi:integrase